MQYKEYDQKLFKLKRGILNITGKELADICRLSKQAICVIENGKSNNKSTITFIGYTLDMLAKEKGDTYVELFDEVEKLDI